MSVKKKIKKSPKKVVKKVIKKITKEERLKKEILELKETIAEGERTINYWKGKYDVLDEKFDEIDSKQNHLLDKFVNRELPMVDENRWLRQTIELLTIPAEKFKKIDEIRRETVSNDGCPDRFRNRY